VNHYCLIVCISAGGILVELLLPFSMTLLFLAPLNGGKDQLDEGKYEFSHIQAVDKNPHWPVSYKPIPPLARSPPPHPTHYQSLLQ
jgi:hypothetical protein